MKATLMATLKARWNNTTPWVASGIEGCTWRSHRPTKGAASTTPISLKTKLPTVIWRTSMADLEVVSTASAPLPRLAPSNRPRATSIWITWDAASAAISSTTARLE